jgi:hypothetical protein
MDLCADMAGSSTPAVRPLALLEATVLPSAVQAASTTAMYSLPGPILTLHARCLRLARSVTRRTPGALELEPTGPLPIPVQDHDFARKASYHDGRSDRRSQLH